MPDDEIDPSKLTAKENTVLAGLDKMRDQTEEGWQFGPDAPADEQTLVEDGQEELPKDN